MFDDEDGVAEIAQFVEDVDQAGGVAAMQADGGLIEDVAGADQARTEAGGKLDALGFAAGERGGEPIEREIFETDVVQEFQALADFDQDLCRRWPVLPGVSCEVSKKSCAQRRCSCSTLRRCLAARRAPTALPARSREPWQSGHSA